MVTYSIRPGNACFTTHVVRGHVPIFTRPQYSQLVCQSLSWCRENTALKVFGYVIMPDHLHLLTSVPSPDVLRDVLKRFRNYTATRLLERMRLDHAAWAVKALEHAAKEFEMWEEQYRPIDASSAVVFDQKLHYIHMNPVRCGFVSEAQDWVFSSARNYYRDRRPAAMEVDRL